MVSPLKIEEETGFTRFLASQRMHQAKTKITPVINSQQIAQRRSIHATA
jgi:hypothetical protein